MAHRTWTGLRLKDDRKDDGKTGDKPRDIRGEEQEPNVGPSRMQQRLRRLRSEEAEEKGGREHRRLRQ
jgi:hypothetical protein